MKFYSLLFLFSPFPSLFALSFHLGLSFLSMLNIRNSRRPRSCKVERWKAIASRLPPSCRWHFERPSSESKLQERTLSWHHGVLVPNLAEYAVTSRRYTYTYVFEAEFQIWPYLRHAELLVNREKGIYLHNYTVCSAIDTFVEQRCCI